MLRILVFGIIGIVLLNSKIHAAPLAYIANQDSNTVSVIKTGTNSVMTSIPVGSKPYGVAVHPGGTKVYVTNQDSHTVSVIDATTNTVSATITLPALAKPAGLAINPSGTKLYILNRDDRSVSVINTATNVQSARIPLAGKPSKIVVNSAGTKAYVIYDPTPLQVTVLDTVTDTVETDIPTAVNDVPLGITIDSTGATVYLSYLLGGIATINTDTNTISAPIDIATPFGTSSFGYNNIVISPDNTKVYVISIITNEIFVVNTNDNKTTKSFILPSGIYDFNGLAITPSGSHLAVTNMTNNEMYLIDTVTGLTTGTISVGDAPQSIGNFIGPDKPIGATLTANQASPAIVGTHIAFTASAIGGSSSYEYQYWLKHPGSAWSVVRNFSTTPTWTWNTENLPAGTYNLSVYVRTVGSSASYEAVKATSHVLMATPPASSATLTPNQASPKQAGTQLTFNAGGSGGSGSYEYQFWLRNLAGTWSIVRDYSTASSWTWNTAAVAPGTYYISVYLRNLGSTAKYEAVKSIDYVISVAAPPASGATLTPNQASPKQAGTQLTFNAAGSGGSGSYEYQFWLRNLAGTWSIARDYSTASSWTWNTVAVAPGTYYISVYLRNLGSTARYEAVKSIDYVINVAAPPASGVALTPTPANSVAAGTPVMFSASGAGGSGAYEYQFWLKAPGGSWITVQNYSPTTTWNWNTTGMPAGNYNISVYARNSGSTASYEAFRSMSYQLTP